MKNKILFLICFLLIIPGFCWSQVDTAGNQLLEFQEMLKQSEQIRIADSIKKTELLQQLNLLQENKQLEKEKLLSDLNRLEKEDSLRKIAMLEKVKSLKKTSVGYPVTLSSDTLFFIYTKIGAATPQERADNISRRIKKLYDDNLLKVDSLVAVESDNTIDIVYGDLIIMSVSEMDALWNSRSKEDLADEYAETIKTSIISERKENSIIKIMVRIGLVLLVIAGIWLLIWLIGRLHHKTELYISSRKEIWFKSLSYRDYTFLSAEQEIRLVYFVLKLLKWFLILLSLYLVLPIIFSIFPFTRGWANSLFSLIWLPLKGVFIAVWNFMPNLFKILVIFFVMKYVIRLVKYIFSEIESEKLKISGFHADWALPTYNIVRFLLYAFMFILIFPYLPGSDSAVFKGVSVFIGVLVSLGSTSAIANMVAGLVITYMRPYKVGDRIKIGEMTGDVIEKTMLVTRLRTIKNEEITIPNSSVLSGNTINYSAYAKDVGLIIHSTVTIGYDVPWKEMHRALIDAALKTDFILNEPKPFVLQTSLDDFFVSYQINAYTKEAGKQAIILSELHKHILDHCNERGIEIMSPHYNSLRDGNTVAIPPEYVKKDYQPPAFRVEDDKGEKRKETR